MSGISITVEMRDEVAQSRLQGILDRLDNRRPLLASIGERLVKSASDNFRAEKGPDGKAWQPLRPRTIKARETAKLTPIAILRARGRLAGSINYAATNDEVRIGTPVEYAAIHQLGGTIKQPDRAAKIYRKRDADGKIGRRFVKKSEADVVTDVTIPGRAITIPARPYLGLSAADEAAILEDATDWMAP